MRIWIVEASEPLPQVDINSRQMRCGILADYLLAAGHQVEWWTSNYSHIKKEYRFPTAISIDIDPHYTIHLLQAPSYQRNVSFQRVKYNLALADEFEKDIAASRDRPDLIFVCMPTLELAEKAVLYGKERGIPVVVDTRDLWPDIYLTAVPKFCHGLLRFLLRSEFDRAKRIYRDASGIVGISKTYLDWSLSLANRSPSPRDRIFPLGYSSTNPIPAAEIKLCREKIVDRYQINSQDLVICFIGTFGRSYDLITLVRAVDLLKKKGIDNVKVIVCGDGDIRGKVEACIAKLGIENVILPGWVDRREIAAIMDIASVGIAPYTSYALQSLPNKPFEYMSSSLALLSSLKGEFAELVDQEKIGLNYLSESPEDLATAIEWMATHPKERAEYGKNARTLLEKEFSVPSIYPQIVEYIESLVTSKI
jgi:glycosyltransferase involved in cell wall biosynthesis